MWVGSLLGLGITAILQGPIWAVIVFLLLNIVVQFVIFFFISSTIVRLVDAVKSQRNELDYAKRNLHNLIELLVANGLVAVNTFKKNDLVDLG